jgi:uncharacterized integral membrane protein
VLVPWRNNRRMENHNEEPRPFDAHKEGRVDRLRRHGHRGLLYTWVALLAAMLIVLVALIVANTRKAKISWVFGDTRTSVIWIIVVSAIVGWVAGMATSVLLRRRTRRELS